MTTYKTTLPDERRLHQRTDIMNDRTDNELLNSENERLTKLVLAYRVQRNHHHLAEKISDMMTFAGCSLTEYQQAVLAAGLRVLLEPRAEGTQ